MNCRKSLNNSKWRYRKRVHFTYCSIMQEDFKNERLQVCKRFREKISNAFLVFRIKRKVWKVVSGMIKKRFWDRFKGNKTSRILVLLQMNHSMRDNYHLMLDLLRLELSIKDNIINVNFRRYQHHQILQQLLLHLEKGSIVLLQFLHPHPRRRELLKGKQ